MTRAVEIKGSICSIVDNNGVFECSFIPSVQMSMGKTFVANDDMEVSCDGKIFYVNKGDIVYVFRQDKNDGEIVTFRNDAVANYIKTQIEERNKHNEEIDWYRDCKCGLIS